MPGMSGLDAMIAIRNEFPDAKSIVLTTYTGDAQVLRSMKAGARGYLLKDLLQKELLQPSGQSMLAKRHSPDHAVEDRGI
jgi:DNA-binding NarL/FixJ family response regulator